MTYSYPNFIPIATTANTTKNKNNLSQNYRLYKFVDGRDPRYQELLSHPQPVKDNQHCFGSASGPQRATTTTFVLYIPGHEGSYTQARSLGAHGTSWTHAQHDVRPGQRALRKGHYWRGGSGDGSNDNVGIPLSQFVYEVYAVDFAEQGGALHGNYLKAQSDYVVHVLQYLQEACQVVSSEIQVVAHSMGGYVAKLALAQLSSRAASGGGIVVAQNVITLATPHNNPLYAFDETIHEVHHQEISNNIPSKNSSTSRRHENENDTDNNNVLWISISGGLRDEMIAPEACEIPTTPTDNSNSLSVSPI